MSSSCESNAALKPGPMRQYRVFYRNAGNVSRDAWATLVPGAHRTLYNVPPVNEAIQVLREHPVLQAVVVGHEGALFNLVVFEQEALAPNAFVLHPAEIA